MDLLKKIQITAIIWTLSFSVSAQDFEKTVTAFKDSYELEAKGEYTHAVEKLKAVYDESSYELNLRLGWLNYLSGLFNESLAFYNLSIKLMPYSVEARLGIVYPASALGKWEEVIAHYIKILEIDSKNTLANYKLGLIYYGKQDYQKAETYFEKVVNLYPFDKDSLLMLAWSRFKLQNYREAKVLFYKVLMYSPDNESATEGLSYIK